MDLTPQQRAVVDAFADVNAGRRRRLVFGGLAGTGKSTVVKAIVDRYPTVVVCTPTGKAAHVLRSKGVPDAVTIHSLIYKPVITSTGALDFESRYLPERIPIAIVDEASMLSSRLVDDLTKKVHAIMYVGDHGQLEPMGDDPGLMRDMDFCLEQIHRQAEGSAIIRFAHHVRSGGRPGVFADAEEVQVQRGGSEDLAHFDVVLVGRNDTRVKINAWIRKQRGYSGKLPDVGEQIICLRNDADRQVWNGMVGTVIACNAERKRLSVETDDGPRYDLPFRPEQFGAEKTIVDAPVRGRYRKPSATQWDFGYAVTVHKSQGSQWRRVAVKEESGPWAQERWNYTAATRASEELRWIL